MSANTEKKKAIVNYINEFINQIDDSLPTELAYFLEYEDGERVPYTIEYNGNGPVYLPQNIRYLEMVNGKYPVFMKM